MFFVSFRSDFIINSFTNSNEHIQKISDLFNSSKNFNIVKIVDVNLVRQHNPENALFYEDARNGDIIVIMSDLEIVAIYRPDENKIINIAKIKFNTK
ncbi:MAG: hypothetical protein NZZ41_03855 [Candidatus Dojkabacteria bacterium]|nr:hypothetical protein [Candidatus Dojkabacteria bacterium]